MYALVYRSAMVPIPTSGYNFQPVRQVPFRAWLFLLLWLNALLMPQARAQFAYPDFKSVAGLNRNGSAQGSGTALRLTGDYWQAGSAWYNVKQPVAGGFTTRFQVRITQYPGAIKGDGFAFVVQNVASNALAEKGGWLGYSGRGRLINSIAVEFDITYNRTAWGGPEDPNDNHVGVTTRGDASNHIAVAINVPQLADGSVYTVQVTYTPGTLRVFLNDLSTPLLTAPLDLASVMTLDQGTAWVGFTAATAANASLHDILSWSYAPDPLGDVTPPVCGAIQVEKNAAGQPVTVRTTASDPESGIRLATFTHLVNVTGYLEVAGQQFGPYVEHDQQVFDPDHTPLLYIRGQRIDPQARGSIVARITNGAGLSRDCDPVVQTLSADLPGGIHLEQNYPNPFNPSTRITFSQAEPAEVVLEIFDPAGRIVATLVRGTLLAGSYEVTWDARDTSGRPLPSGVYLYRLRTGSFVKTKTMVLLR